MGEILFTRIAVAVREGRRRVPVYWPKVAVAAVGTLIVGCLIRSIYGPGWANFFGAFFVALGGFLLAVSEDKSKKSVGVWGMAFVTFGGVLIMVDAFPGWPAPKA